MTHGDKALIEAWEAFDDNDVAGKCTCEGCRLGRQLAARLSALRDLCKSALTDLEYARFYANPGSPRAADLDATIALLRIVTEGPTDARQQEGKT